VKGPRSLLYGYRRNPRRRLGALVADRYSALDATVVEAFFDNFGMAMSLELVAVLDRLCRQLRPRLVVEFGSGVSTVAMQEALAETDAVLVTIDQSVEWLEQAARRIRDPDGVLFVAAEAGDGLGYRALAEMLAPRRAADLLVVDGPAFADRFTADALEIIVRFAGPTTVWAIDDTHRPENEAAAEQLAETFSLRKRDYDDPIYDGSRFSLLFPPSAETRVLEQPLTAARYQ
jgi:predicted O-methyltransferase YrrM